MTDDEVGALRKSVNVYVNAQITDALAATVNEYIYAGATVLNPNWLNYNELKKLKIKYLDYNKIEEIPMIIEQQISDPNSYLTLSDKEYNACKIWENYSWERKKKEWDRIYHEGF
jgi:hypothetical protein